MTVLLVYYSGHGAFSNATEVLINEFDEDRCFFPLEQRLYEMAQLPNVFVISAFDCTRMERRVTAPKLIGKQGCTSNLYSSYGSLPTPDASKKPKMIAGYTQCLKEEICRLSGTLDVASGLQLLKHRYDPNACCSDFTR